MVQYLSYKIIGICVIFFVPHIYDTGKEGREKYLTTFKDVLIEFKYLRLSYRINRNLLTTSGVRELINMILKRGLVWVVLVTLQS